MPWEVLGFEGWDLGKPIIWASLRGATPGKLSWESEQLVNRAGSEKPEGALGSERKGSPIPKDIGVF